MNDSDSAFCRNNVRMGKLNKKSAKSVLIKILFTYTLFYTCMHATKEMCWRGWL